MGHSKNFALLKSYFVRGLWSAKRVRQAVDRWITAEEAAEILGESGNK